jgi:hypothetical protein
MTPTKTPTKGTDLELTCEWVKELKTAFAKLPEEVMEDRYFLRGIRRGSWANGIDSSD